jgi:hypothetical protein
MPAGLFCAGGVYNQDTCLGKGSVRYNSTRAVLYIRSLKIEMKYSIKWVMGFQTVCVFVFHLIESLLPNSIPELFWFCIHQNRVCNRSLLCLCWLLKP